MARTFFGIAEALRRPKPPGSEKNRCPHFWGAWGQNGNCSHLAAIVGLAAVEQTPLPCLDLQCTLVDQAGFRQHGVGSTERSQRIDLAPHPTLSRCPMVSMNCCDGRHNKPASVFDPSSWLKQL